jgi:hypothetical protein
MLVCQLSSCQAGLCDTPLSRQLTMIRLAVNQLLATPLNNVTVTSALHCQSQCLAVNKCAYITFSQSTNTCTLYSTATTSVSVAAALQVYAYSTKNIAVSCIIAILIRSDQLQFTETRVKYFGLSPKVF